VSCRPTNYECQHFRLQCLQIGLGLKMMVESCHRLMRGHLGPAGPLLQRRACSELERYSRKASSPTLRWRTHPISINTAQSAQSPHFDLYHGLKGQIPESTSMASAGMRDLNGQPRNRKLEIRRRRLIFTCPEYRVSGKVKLSQTRARPSFRETDYSSK
jgi:hypothetical protein